MRVIAASLWIVLAAAAPASDPAAGPAAGPAVRPTAHPAQQRSSDPEAGAPQDPRRDPGPDPEEAELVEAERREADLQRRRGSVRAAISTLTELVDLDPKDAASRAALAQCHLDQAEYAQALEHARRALADAPDAAAGEPARRVRAEAARVLARCLAVVGESRAALETLEGEAAVDPRRDPEDAWAQGSALAAVGERERAQRILEVGARGQGALGWEGLLARARCERKLGWIERASETLVEADRAAAAGEGGEPDVLSELGDLYFEADREVEEAKHRSAAELYEEALKLAPGHEGALLGLFRLHRYNWMRQRHRAEEFLAELESTRPGSIEGLIAGVSADLDDGQLKSARERLERLARVAGSRRETRTLQATLAWIENRHDECESLLARLAEENAADASPEREIGRHLLELYRFAEGRPFLERAVARDPDDYEAWTQLGRALANTADEGAALGALERAQDEAGLRQDAWRKNTMQVLARIRREHEDLGAGDLVFSWSPRSAAVLATYLVPFYQEARAELAERYGYTPGVTRIEVFERHADFSVRSTGFEGFPALGVCFGPVVTAVSPLSEMRGRFSWARTSFHEFTHVIHLGLSHNRCPRWITEGLATWEEERKNPAWSRNMRRDLIDARANGTVIPVRELNRAFRGPRILFGYYQGGLLCRMLIDRHGFPPMVRLLEAFDRGLDLDQAFSEVYGTTPEALDQDFARFVEHEVGGLAIEPRWSRSTCARLRLSLPREVPKDDAGRAAFAQGWSTIAWGAWQEGRAVDAEEALRQVHRAGAKATRAEFLRGEIALARGDGARAREIWEQALAADPAAEDFRVRSALGTLCRDAGDREAAERHWLAAEKAFPGFDDKGLAAELRLAELYAVEERFDDEKKAIARWLAWNDGDTALHRKIAGWHLAAGRFADAVQSFRRANEIDPFLRRLHADWGEAAFSAGAFEEALREFEVAERVPPELDLDEPGPLGDEERAELLGWQARSLRALGRTEEAASKARAGLELDSSCEPCQAALEDLR